MISFHFFCRLVTKWTAILWIMLGSLPNNEALVPSLLRQNLGRRQSPSFRRSAAIPNRESVIRLYMAKTMEPEEIKQQLIEYLQKRREQNADEVAKQYVENFILEKNVACVVLCCFCVVRVIPRRSLHA